MIGWLKRFAAPTAGRRFVPRAEGDGGATIRTAAELDAYLRGHAGEGATENALSVAAVYACVRLISGAVSTLPLDIKRRVDDRTREDATDHPLWMLLRRKPNGWMKPTAFRRMLQVHLLLRGNAYAIIVRSGGRVIALLPLSPDRVRVEQQADAAMLYHVTRKDGVVVTYPARDVFHLMGMTLDGVTGVSVLTYARETLRLSHAMTRHGDAFFQNGAQVGSVIRHPAKIGNEALETLRASLDKYRATGERAFKTLVLEEGAEFQPLGMTFEDAQFVETAKLTRSDIEMFFGVPPHMIGDTDKATSWGSGIEQQSIGFVTYTLEDWLSAWEDGINVDLLGEQEADIYARFNRSALVRGDIRTRWEAHVKSLQWGVHSPNEVRALEDENPRDGGDVYYDPPNQAGGTGAPDVPA